MFRKSLFAALVALPAFAGAASAEGPKTHVVRVISDYDNLRMYFSPKSIAVQPGDTVKWVNDADEEHNVIVYPDGYPAGAKNLSSPFMKKKGESFSYTFTVTGAYQYHCIPHLPMGMHGLVTVGRPSTDAEFNKPTTAEVNAYRMVLERYFSAEEFKYKPRGKRAEAEKATEHAAAHKH